MKILTYYDPVISWRPQAECLSLWIRNWTAAGWEPIVVGDGSAKPHPLYDKWMNHETTSKSDVIIKNKLTEYVKKIYARHLAMGRMMSRDEPIAYCDFDVFNNGFSHEDVAPFAEASKHRLQLLITGFYVATSRSWTSAMEALDRALDAGVEQVDKWPLDDTLLEKHSLTRDFVDVTRDLQTFPVVDLFPPPEYGRDKWKTLVHVGGYGTDQVNDATAVMKLIPV